MTFHLCSEVYPSGRLRLHLWFQIRLQPPFGISSKRNKPQNATVSASCGPSQSLRIGARLLVWLLELSMAQAALSFTVSTLHSSEALPPSSLNPNFSELESTTKWHQLPTIAVRQGQHWGEHGDCCANLLHKLKLLPTRGYESYHPP